MRPLNFEIHTFDAINGTLVLLDPIDHNTITIPQFDDTFRNGFDKKIKLWQRTWHEALDFFDSTVNANENTSVQNMNNG